MNYFSKLAFAILLGSASVGTASKSGKSSASEDYYSTSASKSGKSTSSIDEFDCVGLVRNSYWALTVEGATVVTGGDPPTITFSFPAGTTSCPRPTSDTPTGRGFFSCADDTIRVLDIFESPNTNEVCTTVTAFPASELNPANVDTITGAETNPEATRLRYIAECNACDRSTSSKSGKSR